MSSTVHTILAALHSLSSAALKSCLIIHLFNVPIVMLRVPDLLWASVTLSCMLLIVSIFSVKLSNFKVSRERIALYSFNFKVKEQVEKHDTQAALRYFWTAKAVVFLTFLFEVMCLVLFGTTLTHSFSFMLYYFAFLTVLLKVPKFLVRNVEFKETASYITLTRNNKVLCKWYLGTKEK